MEKQTFSFPITDLRASECFIRQGKDGTNRVGSYPRQQTLENATSLEAIQKPVDGVIEGEIGATGSLICPTRTVRHRCEAEEDHSYGLSRT